MLTVLIPCKDERHNILDCIDSVRDVADEILVADSGSTDGTLELVRELPNVRVIEREYVNSANFKNWAIPQATHEWVLVVDADERVTPELAVSLGRVLADRPDYDAYAIRRETYVLGHRLRYSGTQADQCTRLFRRHLRYQERRVHADIDVPGSSVGMLQGTFQHHTCQCFNRALQTQNRYTSWASRDAFDRGKRAGWLDFLFRPPVKFFHTYVFRGGCLDGLPGFIWCMMVAFYSFQKCIKLWELEHSRTSSARHKDSPDDNRLANSPEIRRAA